MDLSHRLRRTRRGRYDDQHPAGAQRPVEGRPASQSSRGADARWCLKSWLGRCGGERGEQGERGGGGGGERESTFPLRRCQMRGNSLRLRESLPWSVYRVLLQIYYRSRAHNITKLDSTYNRPTTAYITRVLDNVQLYTYTVRSLLKRYPMSSHLPRPPFALSQQPLSSPQSKHGACQQFHLVHHASHLSPGSLC
jgi:hypothetical protein